MERRFEARFPSDLPVVVTGLDTETDSVTGTLLDISESGICVLLREPKSPGSLVKLDFADTVLYGQIAYSNEENGTFRTGVSVERVLVQSSDLSNILESL